MPDTPQGAPAARPHAGLHPTALIALITAMTAVSSASNAQYLPSLPAIAAALDTTPVMAQLTVSLFMVAYALAQLVWGPLSDRYGRRHALIAGLALYVATSTACWRAPTIEALIGFRVLQALVACASPVIARAVVRDVYEIKDVARVMAYVAAAFSIAPVCSPIIGAFLREHFGWRANFMFMMLFGTLILAVVLAGLPETKRRGRSSIHPLRIAAGYAGLFGNRIFLGYGLCTTFAFGTIATFNAVGPFYLIEVLGLSAQGFAFAYGVIVVGFGSASYVASRLTPRLGLDRTILLGAVIAIVGGVALTALVFGGANGLAAVCGPLIVVGFGTGLIMPNAQAGAIAPFPDKAGAASGLIGFMQMAGAAAIGTGAIWVYYRTAAPLAITVLVLVLALLGCFWALVLRRRPPQA